MSDYGFANKIKKGMFPSRSEAKAKGQLGVISIDMTKKVQIFRDERLEKYDAYYERRQYDKLLPWDQATGADGEHVPVRTRKPRFILPFSKNLAQRLVAKLIGHSVFPTFEVLDAPDDQEFLQAVVRESKLKAFLIEPFRRLVHNGSIFVRFYINEGAFRLEWFHSKFCYPKFQPNGELEMVEVKYLYDDFEDKDAQGNPKKKWFKKEFGMMSEIAYDNPEYQENAEPIFTEVARIDHELGFVQGEWFKTSEDHDTVDGSALVADIMEFVDELCYSLSQSSNAVAYNQDPQLILKGMDDEGLSGLIRSAMKAWNLGREGDASFLESDLNGVEKANDLRTLVKQHVQDFARVVLLDPEKIVGSAQSAKAMEVLHGPLKDAIDELRIIIQDQLKNLVIKMGLACLRAEAMGIPSPIIIPPGWQPESLNVTVDWPPIFQQTMEDLMKKVQVANLASSGSIISRKTATRFIAKDFGITDVDQEHADIDAQPVLNPFGAF